MNNKVNQLSLNTLYCNSKFPDARPGDFLYYDPIYNKEECVSTYSPSNSNWTHVGVCVGAWYDFPDGKARFMKTDYTTEAASFTTQNLSDSSLTKYCVAYENNIYALAYVTGDTIVPYHYKLPYRVNNSH